MSTLSLLNIIDWIDELAIYMKPDYEIITINPAAASFFACDLEASVGKSLLQVCTQNKSIIPSEEIKSVLETGQPTTVDKENLCWKLLPAQQSPGQKIMLLGKYQEKPQHKEDMAFFIKQVKEITGQDHIQENLRLPLYAKMIKHYYERLIDYMPHNVYWLDKNCMTLGCNQNVLRLIGLTKKEQFVGITYEEMGKLADWTEGQAASFKRDDMEVMRTNQPKCNVEEPILYDENDEPIYYVSSRVPLHNDKGEVTGVVGISVDVTSKKKAEELAKQNAISEKIIQTLKTITGSLSHEIRTPLTGIRLGLQTLKHFFTHLLAERGQLATIEII
nr:PAS domain-containing protein [Legionellales bacterium]